MITECWAEYENCTLDVDADAPELRALATYYAQLGGGLWIADAGDGMIATRPSHHSMWEICRVYVMPAKHGTGLAASLLDTAETFATRGGATTLELWTDTRFNRAHRFYEKQHYRKGPELRQGADSAGPFSEFRYWKPAG